MKSIKKIAYVSAIALVGVGFASCKNNEPTVDGNYNGEVVKTQFSISLPKQAVGKRNMAAETVQSTGAAADFRGMDNIVLVPFNVATAGNSVAASDSRFGTNIVLGAIGGDAVAAANTSTANAIVGASEVAGAGNAHLFRDVQIPLRTNAFLFYAKACNGAVNAVADDDAKKHQYGYLVAPDWTAQPNTYTFAPEQIYTSTLATTKGQALIAYLNSIIATEITEGGVTKKWSESTDPGMQDLYVSFTTDNAATGTGATCASSATVKALVEALYNALYTRANTGTGDAMAIAIRSNIVATGKATADDSTPNKAVITLDASLADYPASETNLPDGTIGITYDATAKTFSLIAETAASAEGLNMTPASKLVYPANLWYYANSAIKTSNLSEKEHYVAANNWDAILAEYATDNGAVQSSTRSVAIKNPIQYAVGRLDVTIALGDATKLIDNVNAEIAVPAAGYPVTAVFVGNQKAVDWKFETSGTDVYTIYDNAIPTGMAAAATTASAANYTLVLETVKDQPVQIAIEMENTGADFVGVDNKVIANGTKFYMVATLTPSTTMTNYTAVDGKVFKQDFVTTANLTIGDLKHAYNVIPDLRLPELELGLSVDLTWQAGLTFTETL